MKFGTFEHSNLEFVSNFGFRYSKLTFNDRLNKPEN
jgi:hypothetical protein